MDDEEDNISREIRKIESMSDDLYLNDVETNWSGSKRGGKYVKRGSSVRGVTAVGVGRNQARFADADPDDLNNFDNWDLERDSGKFDSRSSGIRGRSKPIDRRDSGANGAGRGKPYENSRREDFESMSNTFDIEGKLQRTMDKNPSDRNLDRSWSRESREGPLYGRQLAMDNPELLKNSEDKSGYIIHRKDPRLANKLIEMDVEPLKRSDPRLAQKPEASAMDMYRAPTKDPRLRDDPRLAGVDKNKDDDELALRGGQHQTKSDLRTALKPDQPRGFQNRFIPVRNDPRQQQPLIDFNKPRPETIFEKISNNPALLANQIPGIASEEQRLSKDQSSDRSKRGPRSPSGSVSPGHGGKKDRNGSPGRDGRKRERSPGRNRSNRWERSPSPRGRRERSVSPRRRGGRKDRSISNDRRRSNDRRDWSSSPRRDRQRRERSPSPRRRRRSRSNSADRTASPPPRAQRGPPGGGQPPTGGQQRYAPPGGQPGYDMPPPAHYAEGYPPTQGYPAPSAGMLEPWSLIPGAFPFAMNQPPPKHWLFNGPPQYPAYQPPPQQQYHYETYGYPPQPAYGEYPPPPQVAPLQHGWGNERAMMYPDMSQPPPPTQPPVLPPPPTQLPPAAMPAPVQPPPALKVDVKAEEAKKEAKEDLAVTESDLMPAAAIKNEVLQQKQTLSKQREEYMRKSSMISRELKLLKDQEQTLREENCRDNDRILRENNKLQLEIQNKLKAINNVIDMLTGIIGDKKELEEKQRLKAEQKLKHPKTPPETPPKSSSDSSPENNKARLPEPPVPGVMDEPPAAAATAVSATASEDKKPVFNYVHYDPEMHWCRVCDAFPRTAKEFLNHLHSAEHRDETLARKMVDMPWHKSVKVEEEAAYYKGAPTKRTPIRGLQFFISATAWYCKLCDTWIGDLHCASLHLKSKTHTENYVSFTEQSPHWETDWLADREKAYEHKAEERRQQLPTLEAVAGDASPSSQHDDKAKRNKKNKKERKGKDDKDGKKKKRRKKKRKAKDSSGSESSSSSSSEESSDEESEGEGDKGKSIRVAMRNKMKAFEDEEEMPSVGYMRPSSGWQSVEVKEEERLARELQEKQRLEMELREKYMKAIAEEQFEREQAERERYEMMQEQQSKFRKVPAKEDKMLTEWMGPNKDLPEGERQILTGIRDRVKMRQEAEKDSRKRDDRDRYYDNRYHEEGNRRRRRGESPDGGRFVKRGRSRSPDERRYEKGRGGEREVDRSQGRYKRSPQRKMESSRFQESRSESTEKTDRKHSAKRTGNAEQDEAESKFERQAAEAAARNKKKEKKPVVAAIPKSKLPFIGRMPIMKHLAKKKPGEDEPPPEMKEKLPEVGLVLIGPALPPHMKPPGLVIPEELGAGPGAGTAVQDMDIDDEDSNPGDAPVVEERVAAPVYVAPAPKVAPPVQLPIFVPEAVVESPSVPDAEPVEETVEEEVVTKEAAPKKPLTDIPLPKDFQEALNILFPGQTKPGEAAAKAATPPAEAQTPAESQWSEQMSQPPPHAMGYGPMMGMPPGMHPMYPGMMPGINGPPNFQVPPPNMMNPEMMGSMGQPPPCVVAKEEPAKKQSHTVDSDDSSEDEDDDNDRFKSELSADDLAMLGIDAGDMAAQSF